LFYLDKTVTGFRVALGGVIQLYNLKPDYVTYGKALVQGFPIAAIACPDHIMESVEYGKVLHYGSHNGPALVCLQPKPCLKK